MVRYSIDYSRYINEGFWVSPLDAYAGRLYTPISTVAVEYGEELKLGGYDDITPDDILGMLVATAKEKHANGLISVKIDRRIDSNKRPVWYASGVAVKFAEAGESTTR